MLCMPCRPSLRWRKFVRHVVKQPAAAFDYFCQLPLRTACKKTCKHAQSALQASSWLVCLLLQLYSKDIGVTVIATVRMYANGTV